MVVVPVAAAVGIAFAVLQWVLVSKVKVTLEPRAEGGEASAAGGKYGASEYLIEEEEGLNDHNISEGVARGDTKKHEELELLIKDYPYALDGMEIWTAIKKWVTDYCAIYYTDGDRAVAADSELQAWWSEVRNVGHCDLSDAPWWPAMDYVDDLVETCTTATSSVVGRLLRITRNQAKLGTPNGSSCSSGNNWAQPSDRRPYRKVVRRCR